MQNNIVEKQQVKIENLEKLFLVYENKTPNVNGELKQKILEIENTINNQIQENINLKDKESIYKRKIEESLSLVGKQITELRNENTELKEKIKNISLIQIEKQIAEVKEENLSIKKNNISLAEKINDLVNENFTKKESIASQKNLGFGVSLDFPGEFDYSSFGIRDETISTIKNKKSTNKININWDKAKTKSEMFTIDSSDTKKVNLHTTDCYNHFVANMCFTNQNFQINLEVNVQKESNYLFLGLINGTYNLSSSCGCCNPNNSYFIQRDGSFHINGKQSTSSDFAWGSNKILLSLKVYLSDFKNRRIIFCLPEKKLETSTFIIDTGSEFYLFGGTCLYSAGYVKILDCFEI
jgi:hypothetical protein